MGKVGFLMGPTSSGIAMGLTGFARENKKILVLTQAATDALTGAKFHPYVFSTLSNAMMHSRSGAYLMAAKPYKKYMCVGPDYSYGHSSWKMFKSSTVEPQQLMSGSSRCNGLIFNSLDNLG